MRKPINELNQWTWLAILVAVGIASATTPSDARDASQPRDDAEEVSPVRGIDRRARPSVSPPPRNRYRTLDGSYNHRDDIDLGAADTQLLRLFEPDYSDGIWRMAGPHRPSARIVSNAVHHQDEDRPNSLRASDFLWQWGQFVDHDIDLSDGTDPPESDPIEVPLGDLYFDPHSTGEETISFNRSFWDESTGTGTSNPRQQLNEITAWIDASNVYGSNDVRAAALRTLDETGRLKTSEGDLLPFNVGGLPNAGGSGDSLFLAGDVRANEQLGLTAMHTLFVREHNRLVGLLREAHPDWSGEELYQKARQRVGAEMQVITFREFLPALLGRNAIPRYRRYDPTVDASIANAFSAAAYRFGHSALSSTLVRLGADGEEIAAGNLPLRDAFFAPQRLGVEGGIAPLLRGLASQPCQTIDPLVIDDVRNFLFGEPGSGGFDLASLNIQRGRDHGLPSYNDVRAELGFPRAGSFAEITPDPEVQEGLAAAYDSVDDVDLWTGGLAEPPVGGGHLGRTFRRIVAGQFQALRDGDRYWYRRMLSPSEIREVESTRLSDIIRANSEIGAELPDDVFRVAPQERRRRTPRRR